MSTLAKPGAAPPGADRPSAAAGGGSGRRSVACWILYDWANSVYPTLVVTFVFAEYFRSAVVGDGTRGTELWGWTVTISGIMIAVLSPILGAVADQMGRQKSIVAVFTAVVVAMSAALWFVEPSQDWILWAMLFVIAGNVAFEVGQVFYNAMLPFVARADRIGRVSGWGWAFGYVGGLVCLSLCLVLLVLPAQAPFGLDKATSEHIRAIGPLIAIWVLVFSIPMFLYTAEAPATGVGFGAAVRGSLRALWARVRRLPGQPSLLRFLIASMIYREGLTTLFLFGGLFFATFFLTEAEYLAQLSQAALATLPDRAVLDGFLALSPEARVGWLEAPPGDVSAAQLDAVRGFAAAYADWKFRQILIFGILLNVTSALGAFAMAWIDDWLGAKTAIVISLLGMIAFGSVAAIADSYWLFYGMALGIGLFIGPMQSSSRSYLAKLVPGGDINEAFGIYSLTGRTISFLGPSSFALATAAFGTERAGMASIMVFMALGLALLLTVRPAREARLREMDAGRVPPATGAPPVA